MDNQQETKMIYIIWDPQRLYVRKENKILFSLRYSLI